MAATNRYMNYGPFTFGDTRIYGIFSFNYSPGISTKMEGSDGDPGPTVRVVDFLDPSFTFETYDANAVQSLLGTRDEFAATLWDAKNKGTAAGGGKVYASNANSILVNGDVSTRYREFATRSFRVETEWLDPATPPVSITAL